MHLTDDEVEEGAYVVLDEEEEDNAEAAQQDNGKQPDRTANGSAAQLSDADDDRYVAEAYSAGEDHFDRSVLAFLPKVSQPYSVFSRSVVYRTCYAVVDISCRACKFKL